MSMEKAIKYGKEYRKAFYGAEAVDKTCRCNGSCEYCKGNRLYSSNKRKESMVEKEKEYYAE